MTVSFNAEALAEAEDATHWYRDNGGTQPGRAFVRELQRVIRLAAETPNLGSTGSHNVLRLYLKRFPYTLVYRSQNETLRDCRRTPKPPSGVLGGAAVNLVSIAWPDYA